ncbi:hypothetical protein AQUCO_02000127v1 [Aquilegia coerulea]|uniref:Pectate lyase superfamily protein domain-containing protein n=1 Tax=Aquilegia coerulea TaxID=218851 RepID=A0A2G5DG61_AQUCA|nr:hypothetical protein AQUCO_02000127v1 [Aquilegia coerulea]
MLDDVSSNVLNVMDFGAVGDGKTDDSQAFLKAWDKACTSWNPSTLVVPSDKSFLLRPVVTFQGPCKAPSIDFQIWGDILAPKSMSAWKKSDDTDHWIVFDLITGLSINGTGKIDGRGSSWWECREKHAIQINGCADFQMKGIKIFNSQQMHVAIDSCYGVQISDVWIVAPESSPNTDGIHIGSSKNVDISKSTIETGDDCISIGTGTSNVTISDIYCGPGHGISIGSLGKHGPAAVEQIYVYNCTFKGTQNGARIKTWQGGSGYAKDITFEDIILDSSDNPIIIDQYYCNGGDGCKNKTSAVKVSHVWFNNFRGTSSSKTAINLACSETVACEDIHLNHVHIMGVDSKEVVPYTLNVKGNMLDVKPEPYIKQKT